MRLGRGPRYPDRDDLKVGESCDACGTQLEKGFIAPDAACPSCGSTVRRLPRAKGEAVGRTVDVASRSPMMDAALELLAKDVGLTPIVDLFLPEPERSNVYPFKTRGGH